MFFLGDARGKDRPKLQFLPNTLRKTQKPLKNYILTHYLFFCATPAQGAGQNGLQPPERGVGEDQAREPRAAGAAPGQPGSTPDRAGLPHPGSRRAHQGPPSPPPTQRAGETTREADQPSTNAHRDRPGGLPPLRDAKGWAKRTATPRGIDANRSPHSLPNSLSKNARHPENYILTHYFFGRGYVFFIFSLFAILLKNVRYLKISR